MSLLLDALNKADEERKRNENPPSIGSNHDTSLSKGASGSKIPVFTIAASIGVILAILLVVVYWLGRHTIVINNDGANTSASTSAIAPPAHAPGTIAPTASTQKTISTVNSASQNIPPTESQNNPAENYNNTSPAKTGNTGDAPSEQSVASLYHQNTNAAPVAQPTKTIAAPARTETNIQPAKPEPANPQAVSSIKQFSNLPEIHDLPNNVLERIPSLNYTEHHFNSNGGNVVINGSVRHVNDQLATGLVIDKILEDGMILHIDTYSFKMRALNSWVNM